MSTLNLRLQLRGDTAANWTSVNPILAVDEVGIERDTQKFKFGDGVTAWASLAYIGASGGGAWGSITGTLSDQTDLQAALDAKVTGSGSSSGTNTGDQTITLTGDVTGTGTGTFAATLATAQPAVHTWALAQTFTVAPVFTDQAGTRTALGLGTAAVAATGDFDAAGAASTAETNAKSYADTLVVGLVDDRGNYDASVNTFPASGGSGAAGAVLKGDLWTVSVAGTLGGHPVTAGDLVRALVDTPGQTDGNWAITENNIGYVAENVSNKDTDGTLAANSDTKYPSQKAVKTYADTKATAAQGALADSAMQAADVDAKLIFVTTTTAKALADDTSVQNIFAAANDTFTAEANATYFFKARIRITNGATTHTDAFGFGGTATFTSLGYDSVTTNHGAAINATNYRLWVTAATLTVINATSTAPGRTAYIEGIIRTNAAGTIIPQWQFSAAPGGTNQVEPNSYIQFQKVGADTVVSAGAWA